MAAAIKDATGIDAEMIQGRGGIFDVKVDGQLVYSKHETGRFPNDHDEVIQSLG